MTLSTFELDAMASFTLAILLLFAGKAVTARWAWLQRFSIPDAVIGGILCSLIVGLLYFVFQLKVQFTLGIRDMLLLYFFAAIGLSTNIRTVGAGGKALLILLLLAATFIVLQNMVGMGIAQMFGLAPQAGLMVGSISLTGGVGTTLAWGSHFTDVLHIDNAQELGLAANMLGMIAACLIGGPVAGYLIRKNQLKQLGGSQLEVAALHSKEPFIQVHYLGILLAIFWLNVTLMLGTIISAVIGLTGLNLPAFVGCLLAGILIRAIVDTVSVWRKRVFRNKGIWSWPSMQPGVALISDITLGLFLTMALMGMQLWELLPVLGFISVALAVQIAMVLFFVVFVVYRAMGRNYEAAVISAGFGGIALGSTATAIANMTAVTKEYGSAPQAFIVVPLVCGFFIDLVNAFVIGVMAR